LFPLSSTVTSSPSFTVSARWRPAPFRPLVVRLMSAMVAPPCSRWCIPCRFCSCTHSSAITSWVTSHGLPSSVFSPMSTRSWVKWYSSFSCFGPVRSAKMASPSAVIRLFRACPSFSICPSCSIKPPWT